MQSPILPTRLNRKLIYNNFFLEVIIFLLIVFVLFISFLILKEDKKESLNKYSSIPKDASFVPDQIIVKFRKGNSPRELEKQIKERNEKKKNVFGKLLIIIEDAGHSIKKEEDPEIRLLDLKLRLKAIGVLSWEKVYKETEDSVLKRYYLLKLEKGTNIEKTYEKLTAFYEVENIQPNYTMQIFETPNDPKYTDGSLWSLGSTKLDMEHAWNITKGSNNIKVAVIDTGIDYNHQDFVGRQIINGKDFSTGNCYGINNAYDPPKPRDDDSLDDMGHGTHVAGTIGAVTNNELGIAGINWDVVLMAVKTMSKSGCGQTLDIVDGIKYAVDNGANIINMSLGGTPSCFQAPIVQDVISYAINKNIIIVAAAGNDGRNVSNYQPASCNGVIAVGASNSSDSRASFSNFGARVDMAAPGTSILSTKIGGGFVAMQGTSMASPHVAGGAALLLSACPNLSPQQVRDYLVNNGDPITTDLPIGGKRLNLYKAINACSGGAPPPTSNPTTPPTATPTLTPTPVPTGEVSIAPTLALTLTPAITPAVTISPSEPDQPVPTDITPTPIPYTCVPDLECLNKSGQNNIQLCPLKCTPL